MEQTTNTLSIILSGLAAIGGLSGIAALVKVLLSARNEKEAGKIKNTDATVEALQKSITAYDKVIEDLKAEREEAKAEAREHRDAKDILRATCMAAESAVCINWACPLRDPARGTGRAFLQEHRDESDLGGNYKTLRQIAHEKGLRLNIWDPTNPVGAKDYIEQPLAGEKEEKA